MLLIKLLTAGLLGSLRLPVYCPRIICYAFASFSICNGLRGCELMESVEFLALLIRLVFSLGPPRPPLIDEARSVLILPAAYQLDFFIN